MIRQLKLLFFVYLCTFLEENECAEVFTKVGQTQLLFLNKTLKFAEAERYCESKDSKLLEFWSANEWEEVSHDIFLVTGS